MKYNIDCINANWKCKEMLKKMDSKELQSAIDWADNAAESNELGLDGFRECIEYYTKFVFLPKDIRQMIHDIQGK
jgi:hypothetical protein